MPPITTVGGGRRRSLPWLASSSRLVALALFSVGLAGSVVASAWHKHSHFYAAGIALARSGTSMLALLNLLLLSALVTARAIQSVIFGPLRGIEVEHLYERSWIAVTELLLAMTTFREDFDARFALYFTLLLFLKAFHWITADRVDIMEQLPSAPFLSHFRLQLFMAAMLTLDIFLCRLATASFADSGPSVMLLFGFEYTILASSMLVTAIKYFINLYDARQDNAWESKSTWVFYLDLVHDLFKLVNYMAFFVVIITHYGLPLHALRDLYLTLRSFLLKVRDLLRYRRATRNMNTRYPDATAHELAQVSDRTCIICREDMYAAGEPLPSSTTANSTLDPPTHRVEEENVPIPSPQQQQQQQQQQQARPGTPSTGPTPPAAPATAAPTRSQIPKKLPCGHIFHFGCMRSWLERQQTCPTCRRPLLDTAAASGTAPAPAQGAPAPVPAPANAPPRKRRNARHRHPTPRLPPQMLLQHPCRHRLVQSVHKSSSHGRATCLPALCALCLLQLLLQLLLQHPNHTRHLPWLNPHLPTTRLHPTLRSPPLPTWWRKSRSRLLLHPRHTCCLALHPRRLDLPHHPWTP